MFAVRKRPRGDDVKKKKRKKKPSAESLTPPPSSSRRRNPSPVSVPRTVCYRCRITGRVFFIDGRTTTVRPPASLRYYPSSSSSSTRVRRHYNTHIGTLYNIPVTARHLGSVGSPVFSPKTCTFFTRSPVIVYNNDLGSVRFDGFRNPDNSNSQSSSASGVEIIGSRHLRVIADWVVLRTPTIKLFERPHKTFCSCVLVSRPAFTVIFISFQDRRTDKMNYPT